MTQVHPLTRKPLPNDWRVFTVDELKSDEKSSCVAGPFGSSISSKYFVEEGVPVIRGSNLTAGGKRFVSDTFVYVSEERAKKYAAQHVVNDDLVFTCWGSIGQIGIIPKDGPFEEYIISNKQLKLRVDKEIVRPLYAYLYFASSLGIDYVKSHAKGAAVPGISLGILKGLEVAVPPLPTQDRIVSLVSVYDDLIENNTRRIEILEEMARRLYEEWFVHFRFPGHEEVSFKESEFGRIPEGWEVVQLSEVSDYISRGIAPKYSESDCRVINQKCIRDNRLNMALSREQTKKVPEAKYVQFGDVLINSTGVGTLGRVAQVYEQLENVTVDSHVTIVRAIPEVDIDFFGIGLQLLQPYFEGLGVGATGQTELSRVRVGETRITLPSVELQNAFGELVKPMRQACIKYDLKNANLRAQRDLLLPKLVSGEIDVSDIPMPDDKEVEAA